MTPTRVAAAAARRRWGRLAPAGLGPLLLAAAGCGGEEPSPSTAPDPANAVGLVVELRVRDLLAAGSPAVSRAALVLDGRPLAIDDGSATLEFAAGPHVLFVRDPRYRRDLALLRFPGEDEPRAQVVGSDRLEFDVRPGDAAAELWLVSAALDARFVVSLLDAGVGRRWTGPMDLHVDLSPGADGWALPAGRVTELAAFADSVIAELTDGALRLRRVTTGTGLTWVDFLEAERPGAITLQLGLLGSGSPTEAAGWAFYREARPGVIRSANVFLSDALLRHDDTDWRGPFGHEIGHALSLQHPVPCRRWSRMDGGARCGNDLLADRPPGGFWGVADRHAGRLIYAFRPGTDFRALSGAAR